MIFRAALHQALAVSITACVAAVIHIEQPFLAVLAAQLTAVLPCRGSTDFLQRLVAAWTGASSGTLLLTAFPQQPWVSLPVFAAVSGFGAVFAVKNFGPAVGTLFAMGICASFSGGIVFPIAGLLGGAVHGVSLSIAVIVTLLLQPLAPPPTTAPAPVIPSGWLIGSCGTGSLVLACLTIPSQSVVMTIATLTCVLALPRDGVVKKPLGGILGAGLSLVFIVAISGLTNNLAFFLLGMGLVIGILEAIAWHKPDSALVVRQAAAMFVVLATILPRPEESLQAVGERLVAVLLGLAVAVVFSLMDWAVERSAGKGMCATK